MNVILISVLLAAVVTGLLFWLNADGGWAAEQGDDDDRPGTGGADVDTSEPRAHDR